MSKERKVALGCMVASFIALVLMFFIKLSGTALIFSGLITLMMFVVGCMVFYGLPEDYIHKDHVRYDKNNKPVK